MEGISHEAIALAGHLKLNKLIVLFDDNGISIDGPLSLTDSVDQVKRFEAAGWAASRVDGHDPAAIAAAIEQAQGSDRPTLIACNTTIGYGAPTKAGKAASHGSPLGADEITGAREKLDWPHTPFEIPADVLAAWRAAGSARSRRMPPGASASPRSMRPSAPNSSAACTAICRSRRSPTPCAAVKETLAATPKDIATRTASEFALESLIPAVPEMIGGSADLTGSNNTRTKAMKAMLAPPIPPAASSTTACASTAWPRP